jgi:hypothetical protein
MTHRSILVLSLLMVATRCVVADAQQVRFYDENGVTYRETRQLVRRPTWDTRWEDRSKTVYRERVTEETQDRVQTVYTPVTEYRWQPRIRGRFNPLVEPVIEYQLVPHTYWRSAVETRRVPVTRRELVPETTTVPQRVTTLRMVDEEVITRTAVNTPPSSPVPTSVAAGTSIGGQKLEGDPPRQASGWSSGRSTVRR